MEEWKEYRLGDFMEFNPTVRLPKNTMARKVTMDQLLPHCRDIYNWTYEPYAGGAKFQNGDTIMARITPCLENGKHAFVSFLEEGETAYGSTEYIVIRGRGGISDNMFVYYLTHYPKFKDTAIKSMVGSSGRQRAQVDVLRSLKMFLPPLPEQIRIASILSSLDNLINVKKQLNDNFAFSFLLLTCFVLWLLKLINDNLQQQAQALYKSWFIDFEPFKGDKFEDSELGMIPRGWSVKQLGEITTQVNEKVKERVDVKVLSPITTGELVLSEDYFTKQVFSESISKYIVVKPTYFAYNPARVNIGSLGMNEYDFDGCVSPVYVVFRCEDEYQHFFNLFRRTETFKEEVKARAIGGVRQSLTYKDFSLIKVVYPPIDVIRSFNQVYLRILANAKHNDAETARLASLRDTLLPKLMSGELKISELTL